jgi:hypothetical protein
LDIVSDVDFVNNYYQNRLPYVESSLTLGFVNTGLSLTANHTSLPFNTILYNRLPTNRNPVGSGIWHIDESRRQMVRIGVQFDGVTYSMDPISGVMTAVMQVATGTADSGDLNRDGTIPSASANIPGHWEVIVP